MEGRVADILFRAAVPFAIIAFFTFVCLQRDTLDAQVDALKKQNLESGEVFSPDSQDSISLDQQCISGAELKSIIYSTPNYDIKIEQGFDKIQLTRQTTIASDEDVIDDTNGLATNDYIVYSEINGIKKTELTSMPGTSSVWQNVLNASDYVVAYDNDSSGKLRTLTCKLKE